MRLQNYAKNDEYTSRGLETFSLRKRLLKEIEDRTTKGKPIRLLEIGCGQGILLLELLKKFPNNLELDGLNLNKHHGVRLREDFKKNAAKKRIILPENPNLPNIHFGDAKKMGFKDQSFDIIISQVTFMHIKNKAKALQEVYRILKKGGLALISLGPYSINRKINHGMPGFYKNLNKQLRNDYNPRFLIKSREGFMQLSSYIKELNKQYDITLWKKGFVSKSQRARGFWVIIRRENIGRLNLSLVYNKKLSEEATKLYSKNNPVNFGCIDIYQKKNIKRAGIQTAHKYA